MSEPLKPNCEVFPDPHLAKDAVSVCQHNPWELEAGDKVYLVSGNFRQLATIEILTHPVADRDQDHVQSSKWTGRDGDPGHFERLTKSTYLWLTVRSSRKLQIGLGLTFLSLVFSYLNAAVSKDKPNFLLGHWGWILFALTVLSALGNWAKDLY